MITQEQNREYTRCTKLEQFLDSNTAVFSSFVPFKTEADNFNSNLQVFTGLIPDKNTITTGITADKTALKHQVANALGLVCRKTYSYALTFNNPQLAAQVNTRADKIFRMRDSDVLGFTQTILETIAPLLTNPDFIPYGITDTQLGAIATLAENFNGMIGKADVTGSGNAVANTAIDDVIDKLRLNIKHMDLLIDEFEADNPGFVQGYHINSSLDNIGIRHSGVEGYVRTAVGMPIAGATVKLLNTTKRAVTDLNGYYHIERATPDDYMVECSATGYTTQTEMQHISRGRTEELDWVL